METEGQSRQRVGGGRSFWLLCVVVFCVVARDLGTYVGVEFFVRESKRFMVEQNLILFLRAAEIDLKNKLDCALLSLLVK